MAANNTYAQHLPAGLPSTVVGNGKGHAVNITAALGALPAATQQAVAGNMADAGITDAGKVAQHMAAVALRGQGLPWAAVGQALGYGSPSKPRSGAQAARNLVATALQAARVAPQGGGRGTHGAQAAMPLTQQQGGQQQAGKGSTKATQGKGKRSA